MQFCKTIPGLQPILRLLPWIMGCLLLWAGAGAEAAGFDERAASMAEVTDIRISTASDKVRIVADTTGDVSYRVMVLSNPQRIVVDIDNAWLGSDVQRSFSLDSSFAPSVRVAQNNESTVRIVVESTVVQNGYEVFSLGGGPAGNRVIIDLYNPDTVNSAGSSSSTGSSSGRGGSASSTIDFSPRTQTGSNGSSSSGDQQDDDDEDESKDVDEPVFSPGLKGKIIALDAGHGGSDVGAIGPTGVTEKGVTLRVAQETKKLLEKAGAKVLMTRTTDTEVSSKGAYASDVEELQDRCDVGNNGNADIFLSIHMDSFTTSSPSGTTGYYYAEGSKASQRLSKCISEAVVASLGTNNRGSKSCNFYVVKNTDMPAVLLEVAFISNDKEEKLMNSDEGVEKAAKGIVQGMSDFFG